RGRLPGERRGAVRHRYDHPRRRRQPRGRGLDPPTRRVVRHRRRTGVKFGVALGRLNPAFFVDASVAADELGYESVWLPEHLVFTTAMSRSPHPGESHPPVPPETPIFDAFAYLAFLAARTRRVRLGTRVYNIGLRHPFIAARAVQ